MLKHPRTQNTICGFVHYSKEYISNCTIKASVKFKTMMQQPIYSLSSVRRGKLQHNKKKQARTERESVRDDLSLSAFPFMVISFSSSLFPPNFLPKSRKEGAPPRRPRGRAMALNEDGDGKKQSHLYCRDRPSFFPSAPSLAFIVTTGRCRCNN